MLIQCTKKVLDRLHIDAKAAAPTEIAVDDFFCWHANIITADRRKVLIFVNNSTRLAVICYRPKPPAYKKMYEYLAAGVRELFRTLNVHPEVIEQYLQLAGAAQITTSGTRSQIARMNKVAEDIAWHSPFFREDQELQTGASVELADFPMSDGKSYMVPQERLYEELCRMMGIPADAEHLDQVRFCRSYILKITLDLENYKIFRTIEAPVYAKFYQLHGAIQKTFGWLGYHLHNFTFYDGEVVPGQKRMYYGMKRRLVITDYEDPAAQDYFEPEEQDLYSDRQLMLCDLFENNRSCVYSYDFGDDWEHVITVEERKQKDGSTRFVLLEKEGDCPPEDVGGEGGFEEFMRIMSNPEDPEYENMKRWAEVTGAKAESLEEINKKLRWL